MRKIFVLCILTAMVATAMVWRALGKPSRFGTFTTAPKAGVATLIADPQAFLGKPVEIEGTITEQCKAMGCFFFFHSGTATPKPDTPPPEATARPDAPTVLPGISAIDLDLIEDALSRSVPKAPARRSVRSRTPRPAPGRTPARGRARRPGGGTADSA